MILKFRRAQEKVVDQRVRLLGEIINNIRSVKLYAYESHFASKVFELRQRELVSLRKYGLLRSVITSTYSFIPTLAAVCKCIAFTDTNTELSPSDLHHLQLEWSYAQRCDCLFRTTALQCFKESP